MSPNAPVLLLRPNAQTRNTQTLIQRAGTGDRRYKSRLQRAPRQEAYAWQGDRLGTQACSGLHLSAGRVCSEAGGGGSSSAGICNGPVPERRSKTYKFDAFVKLRQGARANPARRRRAHRFHPTPAFLESPTTLRAPSLYWSNRMTNRPTYLSMLPLGSVGISAIPS